MKSSEETRSFVCEKITVEDVEEWIHRAGRRGLGVALSVSWLQWAGAHVQ